MLCVMASPKAELGISQNIVFIEIYLTSLSYMIFQKHLLKMESKEIGL